MSPVIGVISGIIQGFPRVSGDEPIINLSKQFSV